MKEPCVKDFKHVLACQIDAMMVKTMKMQKKIPCLLPCLRKYLNCMRVF